MNLVNPSLPSTTLSNFCCTFSASLDSVSPCLRLAMAAVAVEYSSLAFPFLSLPKSCLTPSTRASNHRSLSSSANTGSILVGGRAGIFVTSRDCCTSGPTDGESMSISVDANADGESVPVIEDGGEEGGDEKWRIR